MRELQAGCGATLGRRSAYLVNLRSCLRMSLERQQLLVPEKNLIDGEALHASSSAMAPSSSIWQLSRMRVSRLVFIVIASAMYLASSRTKLQVRSMYLSAVLQLITSAMPMTALSCMSLFFRLSLVTVL